MFVICHRWEVSSGKEPDVVAAVQLFIIGEMKQVVGRRRNKFARRLR